MPHRATPFIVGALRARRALALPPLPPNAHDDHSFPRASLAWPRSQPVGVNDFAGQQRVIEGQAVA